MELQKTINIINFLRSHRNHRHLKNCHLHQGHNLYSFSTEQEIHLAFSFRVYPSELLSPSTSTHDFSGSLFSSTTLHYLYQFLYSFICFEGTAWFYLFEQSFEEGLSPGRVEVVVSEFLCNQTSKELVVLRGVELHPIVVVGHKVDVKYNRGSFSNES